MVAVAAIVLVVEPRRQRSKAGWSCLSENKISMPIITALIVAAAAYQAQQGGGGPKSSNEEAEDPDKTSPPDITPDFLENKTCLELLPLEQSLTILEWPISTVSFYRFASSSGAADNVDAIVGKMERRVQKILRANPWLGGWLVRGKGIGSFDTTPRIWYDETGNEMAPTIFQRLSHDDAPLCADTPYAEYGTVLSGSRHCATVNTNPEIVNRKDQPLFRITVIVPSSPERNELALIVSMSHICGDVHTFYRIHHMLLGTDPITSLAPKRELLYSQKVMELMGRQEAHYIHHLTTDPAWRKLFRKGTDDGQANEEENTGTVPLKNSNLQGRVFLIDQHWVANIKASYMAEGNFIDLFTSTLRSPMTPQAILDVIENADDRKPTQSTNDILTSFFWNLVKPDVGFMSMNFRGRLDMVGIDHAGNYANPVPYTEDDYKTAALIRKSLETCRRAGTVAGTNNVPTVLPRPQPDLTFSVITNWSSFPFPRHNASDELGDDDDFDWRNSGNVELVRHLPIIYPQRMIKKMPKRMSFLIIFSSGPEDIGCILIAPGHVMPEIDTCGVIKETIAEF